MNRLILLLVASILTISAFCQTTQVQAKRGVFTEQVSINGQWINRISTDLISPDSTDNNVLATGKAVADYIRSRAMPSLQQVISAGDTLTEDNTIYSKKSILWLNELSDGIFMNAIDHDNNLVTTLLQSTSGGIEFTLSPTNSSFLFSGLNVQSGIQYRNDGTSIFSGNPESLQSNISLLPDYLELKNGKSVDVLNGGKEHKIRIFKDSIVIQGDSASLDDQEYNLSLYLNGLPNTGMPACNLQINNGGKVIKSVAPRVYTALLSQSGTVDPSAAILGTNSIGAITWTRSNQGVFIGTLPNAFPPGKTFIMVGNANAYTDAPYFIKAFRVDESTINIQMQDLAQHNVDGFNYVPIEIRVYP
jgi:hypothetical protein